MEESGSEALRLRCECAAGELAMVDAEQSVAHGVEIRCVPSKVRPHCRQCSRSGSQPMRTGHPQAEVGDGQPYFAGSGGFEDGQQQTKDRIIRIVISQSFLEHFSVESKGREAGVIDRLAHGGVQNFAEIEADQVLLRFLDERGADVGHRLERASEAAARFG